MIAELDSNYIKLRPGKAIARMLTNILFEGRPIPRRWQWTNHFNSLFLKSSLLLPKVRRIEKPIYIIGQGRSGSTLVAKLLSLHPEVGMLNEPKLIWFIAFPEGDTNGYYSSGSGNFRLNPQAVPLKSDQTLLHLYGFYLAMMDYPRIVDKFPELIFRTDAILTFLPDAKFIFLTRNGMDVVNSIDWWCQKYGRSSRNGDTYDWWGKNNQKWDLLVEQIVSSDPAFDKILDQVKEFSRHSDRAAVEWIASTREGFNLLSKIPKSVHLVRYEDLVALPQETITHMLEFCELPPDRVIMDYASKVIKPTRPNPPVDLHTSLKPVFIETMKIAGYEGC